MHLDGVSVYDLGEDGLVRTHRLEFIELNGPAHAQEVPLPFLELWPKFAKSSEPALPLVPMPRFRC